MIAIRAAEERGAANHVWLDSRHTFSFSNYYDPNYMGFGKLRVINEDKIAPSRGFPTHGHRDMEIVTYVLAGSLEHKDSLGTGSIIRPGDVQRMSAGTGIQHSEFNASATDPVHLLQIWILPDQLGIAPTYAQKHFSASERQGQLRLIVSQASRDGSIGINQDVDLYAATLAAGQEVSHTLAPGREAWLQVARGSVLLNDRLLAAGDGAAISAEPSLVMRGQDPAAEILLFDMVV
jgi:redox-sensitive bicupin YhaK (pirin superfamily)